MKIVSTAFILIAFQVSYAQQRIGVDFNSRLINGNLTVQFHKVIRGPFLFTTGICGGSYGPGGSFSDSAQVVNGFHHNSYPNFPEQFSNSDGDFMLRGIGTKGTGVGAFVGLGVFKEFAKLHGFRFNVNHYFLWARSRAHASYRDYTDEIWGRTGRNQNIWHPVGAVSLELYHTYRINGRYTFYWGGKLPYFYSMDKARFHPKVQGEIFYKFLPDISIGITRAVGKCD